MVSPLLQVFLTFATALLVGIAHPTRHPEDIGGMDLDEVFIDVDPTEVEGNKGDALLNDRSDQAVAGGNTWMRVGNKVFYLLKRSDTEERQMNGRIRILKKRDNYNMDGKIRILKKRNNFNRDGKIVGED